MHFFYCNFWTCHVLDIFIGALNLNPVFVKYIYLFVQFPQLTFTKQNKKSSKSLFFVCSLHNCFRLNHEFKTFFYFAYDFNISWKLWNNSSICLVCLKMKSGKWKTNGLRYKLFLQNHDYKINNKHVNFYSQCFVIEVSLFQCINISWHIIIVFNSSQLHVRWITIIIYLCLSCRLRLIRKTFAFVLCFFVLCHNSMLWQAHKEKKNTARINVIKIKYCFYNYLEIA